MAITTSHAGAIRMPKRVNVSPLAAKASRLVRLETGSNNEAELARCALAYKCGRGRAPARITVAITTGVSNTAVASRLNTAVVSDARTNTPTSSRRGRPRHNRATVAPAALNSPSPAHRWDSSNTAARKPTIGANRCVSAHASVGETAPTSISSPAAGTAAAASGQRRGRMITNASTDSSTATDSTSAATSDT